MRTPEADPDIATVEAARRGDRYALDDLTAAYLPLVYNIVGRAMNGHPDVDDVVQETMLRAVRGIGDLRDPAAFRSWLVAIAMTQIRGSYRDRLARPPAADLDVPSPDFTDQTIERLGLAGQRREAAEATRWLDEDDRPVLALWWQETSGELSRLELAAGLGVTTAHAAVRVQRMRERLVTSRTVVRALRQVPQCTTLAVLTASWDGEPSPLWRKRLARHVRECPWCLADTELIPAERLLGGLPLLAVPAGIAGQALSHATGGWPPAFGQAVPAQSVPAQATPAHPGTSHARTLRFARHARHVRHARMLGKVSLSLQPKLIVASVAVVTCAAGGTFAAVHAPLGSTASASAAPAALAAPAAPAAPAVLAVHPTHSTPPPTPPARPAAALPVTATSQRKGVGTWNFTGITEALKQSGASWYYNWGTAPSGIVAPRHAAYVPMMWSAGSVTPTTLAQVKHEGHILLGFNEPDNGGQANMTPGQALALWPELMATGMTLGSPAPSDDAATPGGWLDQFMAGAKARGYRVNFITVHWYGGDFRPANAAQELRAYLVAIYGRYHLPIWLTEFALTSFGANGATFPTESGQAAFVTDATKMLDALPFVQRYAWFALPTSAGSGTTGLFNPGPAVTPVGKAFEAAR